MFRILSVLLFAFSSLSVYSDVQINECLNEFDRASLQSKTKRARRIIVQEFKYRNKDHLLNNLGDIDVFKYTEAHYAPKIGPKPETILFKIKDHTCSAELTFSGGGLTGSIVNGISMLSGNKATRNRNFYSVVCYGVDSDEEFTLHAY